MEPGFGGPFRDSQQAGKFDHRNAVKVMEHQDLAVGESKPIESSQHSCTGDGGLCVIVDGRLVVRHLDVSRTSAMPEVVTAPIHQYAMEPGIEAIGIPQGREMDPDRGQCLLGHVARVRIISDDGACRPQQRRRSRFHELGEGIVIA